MKCTYSDCNYEFGNLEVWDYVNHLNIIHKSTEFKCVFPECQRIFSVQTSFYNHIKRSHLNQRPGPAGVQSLDDNPEDDAMGDLDSTSDNLETQHELFSSSSNEISTRNKTVERFVFGLKVSRTEPQVETLTNQCNLHIKRAVSK